MLMIENLITIVLVFIIIKFIVVPFLKFIIEKFLDFIFYINTVKEEKNKQEEYKQKELKKEIKNNIISEKIMELKEKGIEEKVNLGFYLNCFIERKNGNIDKLWSIQYDSIDKVAEIKRLPLTCLSNHDAAQIVGINPVIYFKGEKIPIIKIIQDEYEINKLNNRN
jgi:hypothetical protein